MELLKRPAARNTNSNDLPAFVVPPCMLILQYERTPLPVPPNNLIRGGPIGLSAIVIAACFDNITTFLLRSVYFQVQPGAALGELHTSLSDMRMAGRLR